MSDNKNASPPFVVAAAFVVVICMIPITIWVGVIMARAEDTKRAEKTQVRIACALHDDVPEVRKICKHEGYEP